MIESVEHSWRRWCAPFREWRRITLRTTTVVVGAILTLLTLFLLVGFGAAIGGLWTDNEDGWFGVGAVLLAMAVTAGLWWLAGRYLFQRWRAPGRAMGRYQLADLRYRRD